MNFVKKTILTIAGCLALMGSVHAVPLLQMYVEGGTYDDSTDTWVTTGSDFTVWVIGNVNGPGGKGPLYDVTLVATVMGGDISGLTITPTTTALVTDPSTPGAPGLGASGVGAHHSLPSHGIFTGTNAWQDFLFGHMTLTDSPIGDTNAGDIGVGWSNSAGQINAYQVSYAGLFDAIHFDGFGYYIKNNGSSQYTFAPFSHDAESHHEVPVPAAILLLLPGLLLLKRRSITQQ